MDYHKVRTILKKLDNEKFIHITVVGSVWKIHVIDYLKHTRQKPKNKPSGINGGKSTERKDRLKYERKVLEENKKRLREMMNK